MLARLLTVSLMAAGSAAAGDLPAGAIFRDCPECPEMVVMPFDASSMPPDNGSAADPAAGTPSTGHRGRIALGRFEVTFDEWEACSRAGACRRNPDDHGWGRGRRPVINVTFADAEAYVAWLSARTGRSYRLPSEAEWQKAHRAGTTTAYWWGDDLGVGRANCRDCGTEWKGKGTAPVGTFAANAFGLFDTGGNVWEWIADCWDGDDASVSSAGPCRQRVIRGGAWYFVGKTMRADARYGNDSRISSYTIGLRVARDLD